MNFYSGGSNIFDTPAHLLPVNFPIANRAYLDLGCGVAWCPKAKLHKGLRALIAKKTAGVVGPSAVLAYLAAR